jgi:hypothetical protein
MVAVHHIILVPELEDLAVLQVERLEEVEMNQILLVVEVEVMDP